MPVESTCTNKFQVATPALSLVVREAGASHSGHHSACFTPVIDKPLDIAAKAISMEWALRFVSDP